jgi:hypothetical protein
MAWKRISCSMARRLCLPASTLASAALVPLIVLKPRKIGCDSPIATDFGSFSDAETPLASDQTLAIDPSVLTVGRQPDRACGTSSSVPRCLARSACNVGLLEYADTMASTKVSAEACLAPTAIAAEASNILVQCFKPPCIPHHAF